MTKQNITIDENTTFEDLKGRHVFLKNLDDKDRALAVSKIPQNERLRLATQSRFPGAYTAGLSFDETIAKAGLDFEVEEAPVFTNPTRASQRQVDGYKALVRTDNHVPLSVVSKTYGTVQVSDAFSGIKSLCDRRLAVPVSAWCHEEGRRFGVAAVIGNSSFGPRLGSDRPEVIAHYIVAQSGHDGSSAYSLTRDSVQLVCFNGATTRQRDSRIYLRHTSRIGDRVASAQRGLQTLVEDALEEQRLFERLAQDRFTLEQFVEFANELLTPPEKDATDRSRSIHLNKVQTLADLFEEGQGNVGQSKLDAYSAVTEWLTPRRAAYEAAKFATKYFNDTAPGARPAKLRERAVRLLTR